MRLRLFIVGLLALVAVALATACGNDGTKPAASIFPTLTPASSAFPVTVRDDKGNDLTLQAAPKRIVALAPSYVEVLFALGADASVVAADSNTDYPPEAASLTKISGFQPSLEGIVDQNPDLVLLLFDPGGLLDALRAQHIPALFLATPDSLDGVYDQISILGSVAGRQKEAEDLISQMGDAIDALTAKIPSGQPGPRVFHEVDNTYYTVGPGSFINDLYTALRAKNIAASTGQAFPQLGAEAIIQADPEVIVLADEAAGESPQTVAARPGWDKVSAVKNQRVYTIDPDIVSRPGPRLVDALRQLAKFLYPDQFP